VADQAGTLVRSECPPRTTQRPSLVSDRQNSPYLPLSLDEPASLRTPIAQQLRAHFLGGGSISEGIHLVERAELAAISTAIQPHTIKGRGTRLSPTWKPSQTDAAFAVGRGMRPESVQVEAEKFRNYWIAKAGANATKRDWSATWRNWIITAMERNYDGQTGSSLGSSYSSRRSSTGSDTVLAAMGRLAQQLDQKRGTAVDQGRQIPDHTNLAGGGDAMSGKPRNP